MFDFELHGHSNIFFKYSKEKMGKKALVWQELELKLKKTYCDITLSLSSAAL